MVFNAARRTDRPGGRRSDLYPGSRGVRQHRRARGRRRLRPRSGGGKEVTLSLVAYSTPQAAYEKIIAAFQKTDAGKNVKFTQSYGASGDQSRAVEAGLPADFVMFSLETDMTRLVEAGMVDAAWNTDEYKGMHHQLGGRAGHPQGQPRRASRTGTTC